MQLDYEPHAALYKYGFNSLLASASGYFDTLRQLRTLQLRTDKEMLAFVQHARDQVDAADTAGALLAVQQSFMLELFGRELAYLRELEKIAREATALTAAAIRSSQSPWQERMAQIAEGAAQFLSQGNGATGDRQGDAAAADRHAQPTA
ncbi:hypothetical protein [Achromobacter ruhlandii]|uniref:hypothetical protein n=1 Tax=Achromobacter ruhlandii TaxID=72557 RepID=UPI0006C30D7D|nr:hypothetical protein [Achromobacter ruhlandii]AMG46784.1 hypothetical protein AL520_22835 [Achromobacter xylosoxidans]OCZ65574.1 hypothetical protein A7P23_13985 [Achromobacter xylosoxidans]CUJ01457.1 Uncharacterised protein [Achromobacter ruhlandii]CUJ28158.1 Uncharacterised protein [Achromobacter ruhlandii]CUK23382.1 Uncharacterised protein [Achromobacter ruhlandii]